MRLRISVVIPTYNRRDKVTRAVRSALGQTWPPLEVIVVDDGSSDGTPDHLRQEFGAAGVVVHCQKNGGPSRARNTGSKLCSGDWIAFLDSDDEWVPEKLEEQSKFVAAHPEVAMVASDIDTYKPGDEPPERSSRPNPLTPEAIREELSRGTLFAPSTVLIRRDAFEAVGGFNESLRCGEDRELWARLAVRYSIGNVSQALVKYYLTPNSLSANPYDVLRDGLVVNRLVNRTLHGQASLLKTIRLMGRADSDLMLSTAYLLAERGERKATMEAVLCSFLTSPLSTPKRKLGLLWLALKGGRRGA